MAMATDASRATPPGLVTSREPVGVSPKTDGKSAGDIALRDALAIVIGAWALLFVLVFSLRTHNV